MGNHCKKSRSTLSSPSTIESTTDRVSSNGDSYPKIVGASRLTLRNINTHVMPRICTSWFSLGL